MSTSTTAEELPRVDDDGDELEARMKAAYEAASFLALYSFRVMEAARSSPDCDITQLPDFHSLLRYWFGDSPLIQSLWDRFEVEPAMSPCEFGDAFENSIVHAVFKFAACIVAESQSNAIELVKRLELLPLPDVRAAYLRIDRESKAWKRRALQDATFEEMRLAAILQRLQPMPSAPLPNYGYGVAEDGVCEIYRRPRNAADQPSDIEWKLLSNAEINAHFHCGNTERNRRINAGEIIVHPDDIGRKKHKKRVRMNPK